MTDDKRKAREAQIRALKEARDRMDPNFKQADEEENLVDVAGAETKTDRDSKEKGKYLQVSNDLDNSVEE